MRLELWSDASAINSGRIWHFVWNSEMHGMVLSGSRRHPSFGWSRPGRASITCRNCKGLFFQIRSEGMMGIGSLISSIQWVPHCLFWKWHGWDFLPTTIFSFARSCSNTNFVWTNFNSYDLFCFRVSEFFFLWDEFLPPLQKCVAPIAWLHSQLRGVFRIVSHSCSDFPGSTLFPDALNVILESRLLRLLLCLPVTLQRDLGWCPWCWQSFEKYSISVLEVTRSMQSPGTVV